MLLLEWNNDKMNLGIKLIDEQHQYLLTIINQLASTINNKSQKKDILYIVDKFIDYSKFHFSSEEELFDSVNYSDSFKHKEEHNLFINKFKEIKKRLENKDSSKTISIMETADKIYTYITNWLVRHILITDRKYVNLVNENKKEIKLKDITVVYVEDDIELSKYFVKILELKIKNIHTFSNGKEALDFFKEKKADVDLIISDLELPILNGIELLKEIRLIDREVPFIILSAYLEVDNLLASINYNLTSYLKKPVDPEELFNKIDKLFFKKINRLKLKSQEHEIEIYLDALGDVAMVSKFDLNANFTYVNDLYCEVSKYKRSELIGKPFSLIQHPDTPQKLVDDIKSVISNGDKWHGQVKNKAKDGSSSYVSMTIFPLYENDDNTISGYIIIKFLITEIVEEKREFKKQVMSNLSHYKKTQYNSDKKILALEEKLTESSNQIKVYRKQNEKDEVEYQKSLSQIDFYEKSMKEKEEQYKKLTVLYKTNFKQITDTYKKLSAETEKNKNEISKLKDEQILKSKEIVRLSGEVNDQRKIILDLRDTIKNIEP